MVGGFVRMPGEAFFCSGRGPGGPHAGPVHTPQVPIQAALTIQAKVQDFQNAAVNTLPPPVTEVVVDRLPGAEAFQQIAPGSVGAENPEDAVEHEPRVFGGSSGLAGSRGQEGLDQSPLRVGQFVPATWFPAFPAGLPFSFLTFFFTPSGLGFPSAGHGRPPCLAMTYRQK